MIIALFAELGTVVVFPLAVAMELNPGQAAAVATIGGADGPMVLFTSLMLAKGPVRTDHGGGLSVPGTGLWRLSVSHQADDSRKAARPADADGEEPDHHFQRSWCSR